MDSIYLITSCDDDYYAHPEPVAYSFSFEEASEKVAEFNAENKAKVEAYRSRCNIVSNIEKVINFVPTVIPSNWKMMKGYDRAAHMQKSPDKQDRIDASHLIQKIQNEYKKLRDSIDEVNLAAKKAAYLNYLNNDFLMDPKINAEFVEMVNAGNFHLQGECTYEVTYDFQEVSHVSKI